MAELYQGKFSGEEIDSAIGDIQGLFTSGTTGQVMTKTDSGAEWADVPKELPSGGTAGQVLSKVDSTDYNTQWIDPPSGARVIGSNDDLIAYRMGDIVLLYTNRQFSHTFTSADQNLPGELFNGYYYYYSEQVSLSGLGFTVPLPSGTISSIPLHISTDYSNIQEIRFFRNSLRASMSYDLMRPSQFTPALPRLNMGVTDKTFITSFVIPE